MSKNKQKQKQPQPTVTTVHPTTTTGSTSGSHHSSNAKPAQSAKQGNHAYQDKQPQVATGGKKRPTKG